MRRPFPLDPAWLFLLWSATASAAPLRVAVDLAGPAEAGASGVLRLTPLGLGSEVRPLSAEIRFPGATDFDLPDNTAWEITAEAQGYWAAPVTLPAGAREPSARLRLLPTGTLQARVVPVAGQELPSALSLRFQSAPARPGSSEAFEGTVTCPVQPGGTLKCEAPAGRLDLRFRSDASVPAYLWGVEVRPGRITEAGEIRLQSGASVAGWVKTEDEGLPSSECRIELAPETAGTPENLRTEQRLQRSIQEARPNERGFFQIAGVAPGRYTLKVSQPGFAAVSIPSVEVREGLEAQVLDPVVLAKPVTFELMLDPGFEPYGEPWRVRLVRRSSPSDPPGETFQAQASREGICSIPNVPAGAYELAVLGADKSVWHSEMLDVRSGRPPHMVQIPVLRIEGLVTRGGEPLASTVWLGRNGRRLRFDSDGEGRFQGLLPEEGTWKVALASEGWRVSLPGIEVKAPKGRSTARIEIAVPDTTLEGEVVDEAGRPIPDAQVSAFSSARTDSRVRTDEKGEFRIHGLPAGSVTLSATDKERESGWVQSALVEGENSPWLRLVVRRLTRARGRVVSPAGGLPGATLLAWPASQPASRVVTAMSGPGGELELELPEGESAIEVLVQPPGFAFRIATVRLDPGRPFEIAVEPHGGTLILEGSPSAAEPLLIHEGVFVPLQPLRDWARMQGAPISDSGRLVIPNMAGGSYALCKGRADASAASCGSGVLSPLGELVLKTPE